MNNQAQFPVYPVALMAVFLPSVSLRELSGRFPVGSSFDPFFAAALSFSDERRFLAAH